jgi:hypothetical protein
MWYADDVAAPKTAFLLIIFLKKKEEVQLVTPSLN